MRGGSLYFTRQFRACNHRPRCGFRAGGVEASEEPLEEEQPAGAVTVVVVRRNSARVGEGLQFIGCLNKHRNTNVTIGLCAFTNGRKCHQVLQVLGDLTRSACAACGGP